MQAEGSGSRGSNGFTLVELLVVIGIIVALLGIMMPVLARVRGAEQRTACLSNLRQVHLSFHYYAMDNHDEVPLGYRAGCKQFNSMIYSATVNRIVLFGLLYEVDLMRDPRVFYCPAETDDRSMLNTTLNPWPPGSDITKHTYCGYGARPAVEIPDDPSTYTNASFPRLSRMHQQAIFADLTALPARVDTRHRTGINVLYADGSAHWVERKTFDAWLAPCTAISPVFNPNQDQIWASLDP